MKDMALLKAELYDGYGRKIQFSISKVTRGEESNVDLKSLVLSDRQMHPPRSKLRDEGLNLAHNPIRPRAHPGKLDELWIVFKSEKGSSFALVLIVQLTV